MSFWKKTPPEESDLDKALKSAYADLAGYHSDDDEYAKCVKQIAKLHKMKDTERPNRVSADTILIVVGNLVGIIVIVAYERANILTSKAIAFIKSNPYH